MTFLVSDEVPVGFIMAWAGEPAYLPDNWKVCDGLTMTKNDYRELYNVVAEIWTPDQGVGRDLFKIPDLRGLFLRGVSGVRDDEFMDPNKNNRLTTMGRTQSNAVGSFQRQSTKLPNRNFPGGTAAAGRHTHNLPAHGGGPGVAHGANSDKNVTFGDWVHETKNMPLRANDHTHTVTISGGGDVETRPSNAYVHWIIKVR
ncbi:phage tail protein [uncultured Cyclobacterium sp.]|uniref:phage tail protein n=1 Tax=uncultured Cyclobacterium sp. TaxID=453820 RepID=UPI0030EF97A7